MSQGKRPPTLSPNRIDFTDGEVWFNRNHNSLGLGDSFLARTITDVWKIGWLPQLYTTSQASEGSKFSVYRLYS